MIVSAGYNIAGPDVEQALLRHPALADCGVVGRHAPERGHVLEAHIVLHQGALRAPNWRANCSNSSSARSRPTSIRA